MIQSLNSERNSENKTPLVAFIFARHETFHPRFSWLKKGFDAAKNNPKVFLQDDAPVILGVGKNMVKAIRYWCNTFKVLKNDSPTEFGQKLLDNEGWDCFLEDPASLWLLHWYLLKPTCEAAAWYFTFNIFRRVEFSDDEIFRALCDYRDSYDRSNVDDSLKKDINCILKMYTTVHNNQTNFVEDSIDCPFTELGLIQSVRDAKRYTFQMGDKFNLPAQIIVATCLEYAGQESKGTKTISISRLLYNEGSPGMVFKLSENSICQAIEEVAKTSKKLFLSDSAGLIQFSFNTEPQDLANEILEQYYKEQR